ncbi:hypothetical protein [Microbacterium mcarthurae (nom. nud.)]|uniref:Protein kinase domain-containing protein n=1 Tax=Microbacterium mcarthurae TaxID=3035918 RepID=A0ABW9GG18_9MICO
MNTPLLTSINWPDLSAEQAASVEAAMVVLSRDKDFVGASARVLSSRSGFVIRLTCVDGMHTLIKVSPTGETREVATEFASLNRLGRRYTQRVKAFVYTDLNAVLALEWQNGPSLSSRWADADATDVGRRDDLRLIALELDRLHARGLVHGDLQPTHIRFAEEGPTLIDFGVSGAPATPFGGGLVHYIAPEYATDIVHGRTPERTFEGDWYALLASAYAAITGTAPVVYPDEADRDVRLAAIAERKFDFSGSQDTLALELGAALEGEASKRRSWFLE